MSIEALALSREFAVKQVATHGYDAEDFKAQLVAQLFGQGALGAGAVQDHGPQAPAFTAPGFQQGFQHLR